MRHHNTYQTKCGIWFVGKQRQVLRIYHFFRVGYMVYMALAIGGINLLTTTYFLAINDIPALKVVFPTFEAYVGAILVVGIPAIVLLGWLHYKKIGVFSADVSVYTQNSIDNYRLVPGHQREVFGPAYLTILRIMAKRTNSERLSDEDLEDIDRLQGKLRHLIDGGHVGNPPSGAFR